MEYTTSHTARPNCPAPLSEMREQFQTSTFTEGRFKAAIAKKLKIPAKKGMLNPVFPEPPFQSERTN